MQNNDHTAETPPARIPWPPILLVGCIGGALALGRIHPLAWPGLDDWPARAIGLAIGALGVALMVWAVITFQRHRANILPHKAATTLITDGPFARFRNPVYLADTMIMLGLADLTKNIWFVLAAAIFVPLVTWLAILPEERHLEAKFSDAYRAYKARSRRWI